jgi:hypothetical protein
MEKKYTTCHNEGCNRPTREPKISGRNYEIHYKDCHVCANLKSNYRITGPERDTMCDNQNWKCAICEDTVHLPPPNELGNRSPKNAVVDHDHSKPKGSNTRGILCSQCNRGMGILGDKNVAKAAEYLERYK